ncbi:MAG TPA: CARDB domain-containing protein, partial [Herpetosiphonaceae bacterium]|nr:CARDB domain-containing protein [Herpetosiphonaceae bacterium]
GSGPTETLGTSSLPAIAGGGVVTATFSLTRPERADSRYIVRVLPPDEWTESTLADNEAILGMELAATTLSTLYAPGAAVAQVRIDSAGALPSTAPQRLTLSVASPDGPVLHDTWFSLPVTSTASVTVALSVLTDDVGPGRHVLHWNVDPGQTLGERDRSDNSSPTLVVVGPDLAAQPELVEFGRQPGPTAALALWVRNEGSQASAAGTIAVYSAPPGQSGSRLLGTLALPALQPGGVIRVAQTLTLSGQPEAATGLRALAIQLDPANAQAELNENNNLIVVGEPFGAGSAPSARIYLPLLRR